MTARRRHRLYNLIGDRRLGRAHHGPTATSCCHRRGLGLAPLGDYGGPTQTMALLPGSPAIGKGVAVAGVTTDQRGFALDSPDRHRRLPDATPWWSTRRPTTAGRSPPGKLDLRRASTWPMS